jgi:hypothetical protein
MSFFQASIAFCPLLEGPLRLPLWANASRAVIESPATITIKVSKTLFISICF